MAVGMSDKSDPVPPRAPYDPGWNDPPKFVYNPNEAAPKVKLNLNKRVAFPMTQSPGSTSRTTELAPSGLPMPHSKNAPPLIIPSQFGNPDNVTAPPPPALIRPPPVATNVTDVSLITHGRADEVISLEELKQRSLNAIDLLIKVGVEKFDPQQMEEISSRLTLCRKDIDSDMLSPDVLKLLGQIHKALTGEDHKPQEALHYQQLLMVNHIQQCSLWGPAVKRVISCTLPDEPEEATVIADASESLDQVASTSSPTPNTVQYFQPQRVDALVDAPLPPTIQESSPVAEDPITKVRPSSEESESPPSQSLFQKIKSRILHV